MCQMCIKNAFSEDVFPYKIPTPLRIESLQLRLFTPGSVCTFPILPTPGQPCTLPGALNCQNEHFFDNHGGTGNCCCGRCDIDMTCAHDPTTGFGLWEPMHSTLCPAEGCGTDGEWLRSHFVFISPRCCPFAKPPWPLS